MPIGASLLWEASQKIRTNFGSTLEGSDGINQTVYRFTASFGLDHRTRRVDHCRFEAFFDRDQPNPISIYCIFFSGSTKPYIDLLHLLIGIIKRDGRLGGAIRNLPLFFYLLPQAAMPLWASVDRGQMRETSSNTLTSRLPDFSKNPRNTASHRGIGRKMFGCSPQEQPQSGLRIVRS